MIEVVAMAGIKGVCRCGTVMQLTATNELFCDHCDRSPDCHGLGRCARHALFEQQTKQLAMETGP